MWTTSEMNISTYDYKKMKQIRSKLINIQELNNIRLKRVLYYKNAYCYDMVLDEYI